MEQNMTEITLQVQGKKWYQSKTIWFNIGTASLEVLQLVGTMGLLPPGTLLLINGVGNILLRTVTDQPLAMGQEPRKIQALMSRPDTRRFMEMPRGG